MRRKSQNPAWLPDGKYGNENLAIYACNYVTLLIPATMIFTPYSSYYKMIKSNRLTDNPDSFYARYIIGITPDPLVTINVMGKIIYVNDAMVRVTDTSREELIGTSFTNYFVEEERARIAYKEVFTKGSVLNYPLTISDGTHTTVLLNGSVYQDMQGNMLGAVLLASDHAEPKQIRTMPSVKKRHIESPIGKPKEERSKAENAMHKIHLYLASKSQGIRTQISAL